MIISFILCITMILLYKLGDMGEITFFITVMTFSTHMAIQAFYGLAGKEKGEDNEFICKGGKKDKCTTTQINSHQRSF